MDEQAFAFGIIFPGTDATDVVNASMAHSVHLVAKEPFDPQKQYNKISDELHPGTNTVVYPLFIFHQSSILANDEQSFKAALAKTQEYLS